jgi:hypothetical protein
MLGKGVSYHGGRTPSGVLDISCAVNVDPEIAGDPPQTLEAMKATFETARRAHDIVGVMLHHDTYTSPAKFELLRALLRWIRAQPGVTPCTIEQIAAGIA